MNTLFGSLSILLCLTISVHAQGGGISDYLKNLPEKYKTFRGDFSTPSEETIVLDEKNGYAGYVKVPEGAEMYFEMALFKSRNASPLVVVSNEHSDMQCNFYETFFLRRVGNKWVEVKAAVLPPIDPKLFWDDPRAATRLAKIVTVSPTSAYRFELPRRGRRMKVSLEICDFIDEATPEVTLKEFDELIKTAKPVRLDWDSKSGKFKLLKS